MATFFPLLARLNVLVIGRKTDQGLYAFVEREDLAAKLWPFPVADGSATLPAIDAEAIAQESLKVNPSE